MITGKMEGDKLVLTIDCSKAAREQATPSKTGKTLILASTGGFSKYGDVAVSLNCTLPLPAAKA